MKNIFIFSFVFLPVIFSSCGKKQNDLVPYGELAYLHFFQGDLEQALEYTQKAMAVKNEGESFGYLKARILLNQQKKDEALSVMEETFSKVPEKIQRDDLQIYMFLLAESNRYKDCLKKTELYFEKFGYFQGLGQFASTLYENNSQYFNAVLSAFWDFEYLSNFINPDEQQNSLDFLNNIEKLIKTVQGTEKEAETNKAAHCIKSLYQGYPKMPQIDSDFFLYKFICLKQQIISGNYSSDAINEYMQLEQYFSTFPSYYWNLFSCLRTENQEELKALIPLLEKTVDSGIGSIYSKKAKAVLASLCNLSEKEGENLCTARETAFILQEFSATADSKKLEPLFALLALPDCPYVFSAIQQTRDFRKSFPIDAALQEKLKNSSGRLKDRLNFILN